MTEHTCSACGNENDDLHTVQLPGYKLCEACVGIAQRQLTFNGVGEQVELLAAKRTLVRKKYTYLGGDLWKPPLGPRPVFEGDPVHVDLHRRGGGDEAYTIDIVLKFGVGRTITASIALDDFGLLLTGRSEIPARLDLRNLVVSNGKEW